jgi:hypothetical protein
MIPTIPANTIAATVNWQQEPAGQTQQAKEAEQAIAAAPNEGGTRTETDQSLKPPRPTGSSEQVKQERPGHSGQSHKTAAANQSKPSANEQALLQRLKVRDDQVRAHEQAHMAAGAQYISRGAQYEYQVGPDGNRYAVSGEVQISVSKVPGDPEATLEKAQAIKQAALAPARPSAQDRQVAAQALQMQMEAQAELTESKETEDLPSSHESASQEEESRPQAKAGVDVFI